jgi:hypothetical protein
MGERECEVTSACVQLAACVDMSVELSDAALNFIRCAIEGAAAKAQASRRQRRQTDSQV